MRAEPVLNQLNFVVRDMDATVAFYRKLGLPIDADPASQHASVQLSGALSLEFDTTEFVTQWDSAWRGATGGSTVIGFTVDSRAAVDEVFIEMTAAGYPQHQRPYDAFWGARYAIIDDPDGNPVGIMSPIDPDRKTWPPEPPPTGP